MTLRHDALGLAILALLAAAATVDVDACTPTDAATAATVAGVGSKVVDAGCVVLEAIALSGAVDSVCATAEELAGVAALALADRAAALTPESTLLRAEPPDAGGCVLVAGVCLSPREIARGVAWIHARRRLDAGRP